MGRYYPWPTLDRAALYGLAGEIVEAIAPNTEAAPVAMLLTLLTAFGNAAGAGARAMVLDDEHPARLLLPWLARRHRERRERLSRPFALFSALPTTFGFPLRALAASPRVKRLSHDWVGTCEPTRASRSRNAPSWSSPNSRICWSSMRAMGARLRWFFAAHGTRGACRACAKEQRLAEGAHSALLGHVTPDELRAKMPETDFTNGFANRVLLASVKRTQRIASPAPLDSTMVGSFAKRLRSAMDFARERRVLTRTPDAETIWAEFYNGEPERDGIAGAMTARAAAQRLRLSVTYALLDESSVIRPQHVLAAEAVWRYCADSIEHLFGGLRGDHVQDRLLQELRNVYEAGLDGAQQHALLVAT